MPDLPPTPKPGEVWENDDGERRFVASVSKTNTWLDYASTSLEDVSPERMHLWHNWAIRTNARCVLPAKEGK